jgi:hypothetical protein
MLSQIPAPAHYHRILWTCLLEKTNEGCNLAPVTWHYTASDSTFLRPVLSCNLLRAPFSSVQIVSDSVFVFVTSVHLRGFCSSLLSLSVVLSSFISFLLAVFWIPASCMYVCTYVCVYVCVYSYVHMYVLTCVCVCVCVCTYVYTHTHTHSYVATIYPALFISNLFVSFETLKTSVFGERDRQLCVEVTLSSAVELRHNFMKRSK